jgi:outer membrane receptor for ferrienterochelin and colicins
MPFDAVQQVFFGQMYLDQTFGARHDLLAGLAYRYTAYDDNTVATTEERQRALHASPPKARPCPGSSCRTNGRMTEVHKLLLGYRLDHDRDHGLVQSSACGLQMGAERSLGGPRQLRHRLPGGEPLHRGPRRAHRLANGGDRPRNCSPNAPVNGTLNVVRKWPGEKRHFFGLDASVFHTRFSNRILPDYDTDPDLILYANLAVRAVSHKG